MGEILHLHGKQHSYWLELKLIPKKRSKYKEDKQRYPARPSILKLTSLETDTITFRTFLSLFVLPFRRFLADGPLLGPNKIKSRFNDVQAAIHSGMESFYLSNGALEKRIYVQLWNSAFDRYFPDGQKGSKPPEMVINGHCAPSYFTCHVSERLREPSSGTFRRSEQDGSCQIEVRAMSWKTPAGDSILFL